MNEIAIIKELMTKTKTSGATLAKDLGKIGPDGKGQASYVTNRLQSRTMTVEKLVELLDALNCELVIRHTRGDKETYMVTNDDRQSVKNYKKDKKEGEE